MKLKPVKHYKPPNYPTQDYLLEHPELLRLVPKRWQGNRVVLTALTAVALLMISCQGNTGRKSNRVAPIFVHGNGVGTYGCMVISPPVFFTESEACRIIQDEASLSGLNFAANALRLPDANIPVTRNFKSYTNDSCCESMQKHELSLDGYDRIHHIAYEFVSEEDFSEWKLNSNDLLPTSSVWTYDYKNTANCLRLGLLKDKTKTTYGVFYEPAVSEGAIFRKQWTEDSMKVKRHEYPKIDPKQYNEEQLRLQVRDFIQWLKSEEII
jgi:hypothetical protein